MFWEPSESSTLPTVVFHKGTSWNKFQTLARYYFEGKMDGQQKTRLEIDPKCSNILLEMDPNRRNSSWFSPEKNPKTVGKILHIFFAEFASIPTSWVRIWFGKSSRLSHGNFRDVKFGFQMKASWDIGLPLRVALPDGVHDGLGLSFHFGFTNRNCIHWYPSKHLGSIPHSGC